MKRTYPYISALVVAGALFGCQTSNTEVAIANGFPEGPDAPTLTKTWFRSTLYLEPIAPGATSESLRVGTGAEPAWAILSLYDPRAPDAPPSITVARTRAVIAIEPGDERTIVISPETAFVGCGGPGGLSPEDYAVARERIFPGEGLPPFDPATGCVAKAPEAVVDGGAD